MAGYIHIFRSEVATGTLGRSAAEYQLTYTTGGNSYASSFGEAELEEFLVRHVGLTLDEAGTVMDRVRLQGNATLPDIELRETEIGAMGLEQSPSDF